MYRGIPELVKEKMQPSEVGEGVADVAVDDGSCVLFRAVPAGVEVQQWLLLLKTLIEDRLIGRSNLGVPLLG